MIAKEPQHMGAVLVGLARGAIAEELDVPFEGPDTGEHGDWLEAYAATFVTLREDEELRGCMGTVEAFRPLEQDVRLNALAAAFRDPRFPPLRPVEFQKIDIEVSLLSPLEELEISDEPDALRKLRPGKDGILLRWHQRQGTFLPQVWGHYQDAHEFLRGLKIKAGLPGGFWDPEVRIFRYTVDKFTEKTERLELVGVRW